MSGTEFWTKNGVFLETLASLVEMEGDRSWLRRLRYLRRSSDAGWPNFSAMLSFSSWYEVCKGAERDTVYVKWTFTSTELDSVPWVESVGCG